MFESEEEGRISIQNNLNKGDFYRAFDKIDSNLLFIQKHLQELREYSLKMGSKIDSKDKSSQMYIDQIILNTGNIFQATNSFITQIKNFKYINKNEKTKNVNKAKEKEAKYNTLKTTFEDLTNKIKLQGMNIIDSARNSLRISEASLNRKDSSQKNTQALMKGKQYFEEIVGKEKQIDIIMQVTNQINQISKQTAEIVLQTGEKINTIEDNVTDMNRNIVNAVENMKDAKKSTESTGGFTNKLLYIVMAIVIVLVLMSLIMPSN